MKRLIYLAFIVVLLLSCDVTENEENTEIIAVDLDISYTIGFDDFGSPGAAMGIGIDEAQNAVLVIGFKFDLPFAGDTFSVENNVEEVIADYQWGNVNSVLEASEHLQLFQDVVTNTAGLRTMPNDIVAFLITNERGPRYFIAESGSMNLNRNDGPEDIAGGDLTFVEISHPGSDAELFSPNTKYELKNIYFDWDTSVQPE